MAKDKTPEPREYDVNVARLHQAVLDAVAELRYELRSDTGIPGTIGFNTGLSLWSWSGQDVQAVVEPAGDGRSRLTLSVGIARRGMSSIQLVSWGEGGRVLKKVQGAIDAKLASAPAA